MIIDSDELYCKTGRHVVYILAFIQLLTRTRMHAHTGMHTYKHTHLHTDTGRQIINRKGG